MSEETAVKQEATPEATAPGTTPDVPAPTAPLAPGLMLIQEAVAEITQEVRIALKKRIKAKLRELMDARKVVRNLEIEVRAIAAEAGE